MENTYYSCDGCGEPIWEDKLEISHEEFMKKYGNAVNDIRVELCPKSSLRYEKCHLEIKVDVRVMILQDDGRETQFRGHLCDACFVKALGTWPIGGGAIDE